ncbi:MAG: SDR family NAD(P)-dependent oxidoreductase, partial [Alphaproteobacteria bacterium]
MSSKVPSRNALVAVHDTAMAGLSFVLAVYMRLGGSQMHLAEPYLVEGTLVFTGVCAAVFSSMRVYRGSWRYTSMRDIAVIVRAISLSVVFFFAVMFLIDRTHELPRSVPFINWMLLLLLLCGPRFFFRALHDHTFSTEYRRPDTGRIPVLLMGVNDNAERFLRDMARDVRAPYEVVAIIDTNEKHRHYTLHRIPVYGGADLLDRVVQKLERKGRRPHKIILTEEQYASRDIRQLLEQVDTLGIPLARLPRSSEFQHAVDRHREVRPIIVEDLLGRSQNVLDRAAMQTLVAGKRILVTGAGGTIGSELTRQIASYGPTEMVLLERSEFNLYKIDHEIRSRYPELPLHGILADVGDEMVVDRLFAKHKPQIVFHAAAVKHVPLAEHNVEETVLTNVFGTRTIAEATRKHAAAVMVMISTDKAVNPTNVMGASKRLAECFCQALGAAQQKSQTRFITVRFGNVLGSTGSVVPLFQEQIAAGGPVTVT